MSRSFADNLANPMLGPIISDSAQAADTFAALFLMPEWLINLHPERQRWDRRNLSDPVSVYQLALRMGVSYEALCRTLRNYNLYDSRAFGALDAIAPREIKQRSLKDKRGKSWHPNVWLLTERDEGSIIYGEPSDIWQRQEEPVKALRFAPTAEAVPAAALR